MSLLVRTYDPKQVIITFGVAVLTGYAEGTFVKIARSGNAFDKRKGADGTVDRVNKNANDFGVSITLMQTAPVNAVLSALLAADQISNVGVLPLVIKDLNGTTLFTAAQAWIEKDPDDEFADGLGNREWKFATGPGAKLTGGNS